MPKRTKISDKTIAQIRESCSHPNYLSTIAKQCKISTDVLYRVMRENNISRPPRPKGVSNRNHRVELTTNQIESIRSAFNHPITMNQVATDFDISLDVLHRIMLENNIEPYYSKKSFTESDDSIWNRIKLLLDNTDLNMKKISIATHVDYMKMLSLIKQHYGEAYLSRRSASNYSKSKQGDLAPSRIHKFQTGHGYNWKNSHTDDGSGYNLVMNQGVLDKTNRKDSNETTFVYEHQKVFLPVIGLCKMPKGFVIHHIDGNKKNNNLHNLCLLTASAHRRLHSFQNKIKNNT